MPKTNLPRPVHICNCGFTAWTLLTKNYITVVSIVDAHFLRERAWSASENKKKRSVYAVAHKMKLHRRILDIDEPIDHENGSGLDNRRENLRPATNQQNGQNARPRLGGTSKYKGVCWVTSEQVWMAYIRIDGKHTLLGRYHNEIFAAEKYDEAALQHFGPYARLNFPQA
jgi:hypothetical protein